MTVLDWLRTRVPAPPAAMMTRVVEALGNHADRDEADASMAFLDAATELLEKLLQGGELGRDSAVDLLAVDALVTYAFEAAGASANIDQLDARATVAMTRLAA